MSKEIENLFNGLVNMKTKELEECNQELNKEIHNPVVRKALLTYRSEILECLETYDYYLGKDVF